MNGPDVFTIVITAEVEMTVDEVWSDGDAPKDPTADDVAEAMLVYMNARHCSVRKMLDDWGLLNDLDVGVEGPGFDGETTFARVLPL